MVIAFGVWIRACCVDGDHGAPDDAPRPLSQRRATRQAVPLSLPGLRGHCHSAVAPEKTEAPLEELIAKNKHNLHHCWSRRNNLPVCNTLLYDVLSASPSRVNLTYVYTAAVSSEPLPCLDTKSQK
ncbi:hypothetical protein Anapl_09038 [Anas platyrhynchos]|uniref:Uncharacterized protein n=1 Tax=Anas platyrhynchos TaxID=8839 RepID=R0KNI8_ANAPL|nr:hypothetical protein Anapl_09038 [Anas platyrhynchos]